MSLLEKNVRDTLISIIASPHRKAYMHLRAICTAKNLDTGLISTVLPNSGESSFSIVYTSAGNIKTECHVDLDEERYKRCVYVKIGWRRKAFRLATIADPSGSTNQYGGSNNILKKNLLTDIGFQKAFFTKVIDYLESNIKDDVENAAEKIKLAQEKEDIVLQFPDWTVESMYGRGWRLEHNVKKIKIEMSKELDIEKIMIPTDKYVCYPDDAFMENLLNLFEEKVNSADNSPF